jgi:hypothetical protein
VLLDDVEGEVVTGEGELDDHHAGGEQAAEGVDDVARGPQPALVAVAPPEGEDACPEGGEEGKAQEGAAEASHQIWS